MATNPFAAPGSDPPAADLDITSVLFSFDGRIPRRHYWAATLGTTLLFYMGIFSIALALDPESPVAVGIMMVLYVPMIWTSLAIQIKRWHDRGKSGWYIWVNLIPVAGPIWSFIELGILRGDHGNNEYGADPT